MSTLLITGHKNRPTELTAKVDGVEIPLIMSIVIESDINCVTIVTIKCAVQYDEENGGVLIDKFTGE